MFAGDVIYNLMCLSKIWGASNAPCKVQLRLCVVRQRYPELTHPYTAGQLRVVLCAEDVK